MKRLYAVALILVAVGFAAFWLTVLSAATGQPEGAMGRLPLPTPEAVGMTGRQEVFKATVKAFPPAHYADVYTYQLRIEGSGTVTVMGDGDVDLIKMLARHSRIALTVEGRPPRALDKLERR